MKLTNLMPLAGINQAEDDEDLQVRGNAPKLYVRDAVNVSITPAGRADIRPGARAVSDQQYRCLWQSPLHGDTFAVLGDAWGRVSPADWSFEPLMDVGGGDVWHALLNNEVLASTRRGIVRFDGARAQLLALPVPGAPTLEVVDGSMDAGTYSVCVSWLRAGMESPTGAVSMATVAAGQGLAVTFPWCMEDGITHVRLYVTRAGGGVLGRGEDYPIDTPQVALPALPALGSPPAFRHMSPMPAGRYLGYWRGRLLVATSNVLRFSQALAYHVHDERHDFVQLPQRITFVQPVASGIWVGQYDHVLFLRGMAPDALAIERKACEAPIAGSACAAPSSVLSDLGQSGEGGVIWLARNGYVIGGADGQLRQVHAGKLNAVHGAAGVTVLHGERLVSAVN